MEREKFKNICESVLILGYNTEKYYISNVLGYTKEIAKGRIILKRIRKSIDSIMNEWDRAENKQVVEVKLKRDQSVFKVSEEEINLEMSSNV